MCRLSRFQRMMVAESREAALAAGCNEYVTKPIDFDQLNNLITRFLAKNGE